MLQVFCTLINTSKLYFVVIEKQHVQDDLIGHLGDDISILFNVTNGGEASEIVIEFSVKF